MSESIEQKLDEIIEAEKMADLPILPELRLETNFKAKPAEALYIAIATNEAGKLAVALKFAIEGEDDKFRCVVEAILRGNQ